MDAKTRSEPDPLLVDQVGHIECLLGNEAIVRGALEAGVTFACGYPGTPSSEVTDSFARIASEAGLVFEYSINEKICVEMAFAASLAGARSICAMKHLGLMAAGDPVSTIPYVGVEAGMVIVSAGDPSCRTSPNEQDQRRLGPMLHLPVLDPTTPAEALEMTRFAFELSEASRLPVLLRTTTRVCHSRAPVVYGERVAPRVTGFQPNPSRYIPVPHNARRMRLEIDERMQVAREMIERSDFVRLEARGKNAVLCSGAPAPVCAELVASVPELEDLAVWTVGAVHPLPEAPLVEALRNVERVLVVEELSPFLEDAILGLCARRGLGVEVLGKRSGHLPEAFEYEPDTIQAGLEGAFGVSFPASAKRAPETVPERPPSMCPGCPHRAVYMAARAAFDDDQLYFNDIGCYTLGFAPPLRVGDALLCMGAGFSLADGVSRVTGKRTVGFMGDSTFFHSGMPALLNAVKERANMVAVILDNQVTAMTGFQDSPSDRKGRAIEIEPIVRALGVEHLEKIDAYDTGAAIAAFTRARDAEGVSVVLVERACPIYEIRRTPTKREPTRHAVDPDRCRVCGRADRGMRCGVPVTEAYERNQARARSLQQWPEGFVPPAEAPCGTHCPLSLCFQGYVGHVAAGEYSEALEHILERTALPEIVCRTCHRPCESVCLRADVDEPIAINDLKHFVVDWADRQPSYPHRARCEPDSGWRVAVVGAGPSGLAAAQDLRLRGHAVTLFDAAAAPGGVLGQHVPRYRMPADALARDVARVLETGVEFVGNTRIGKDRPLDALLDGYDAVYLAVGAHAPRQLRVEGVDDPSSPSAVSALQFLAEARAGTRTRVPGRVVVIGGGNAAVDAARTARQLGAHTTTIACLEPREAMPALGEELEAAAQEGIHFVVRHRPERFLASAVRLRDLEADTTTELECELVIEAIGQRPDLALLDGSRVSPAQDEDGCLVVDPETAQTSVVGLFAGGDLVPGARNVTAAMAWGLRAAWSIDRTLRGEALADRRPPPSIPESGPVAKWPGSTPTAARRESPRLGAEARIEFVEVLGVMSEADARAEAQRCLACGQCGNCRVCVDLFSCPALVDGSDAARIDPDLCIDCGVCVNLCPSGAIGTGGTT